MGSKIESKKIMEAANVPVVPGYFGENQDKNFLIETARKIGYPIMIKADLGGGGKGMRIVHNENEFFDALNSAQNEATKSFGSAKVLMEKYIANSRHIEVQVFGDNHGNYVHLFERDCTIQRRHQKVVEEAPSYLQSEIRSSLCNSAITAAKAVGYQNAGTVEFIYDIDQSKFYFMEMNTRLQVEHPISEMITGQDFVEWQLLVAAGNKLPKKQEEIKINGHAVELRIYAEDPQNLFLPGTGKIIFLQEPNNQESEYNPDNNVRVETGIRQGDEVSVFYDPMISKLVCWAPTRDLAIKKSIALLEAYKILGLKNNITFVKRILEHPTFSKWDFDTNFIEKYKKDLIEFNEEVVAQDVLMTVLTKITKEKELEKKKNLNKGPWGILDNFRINFKSERKFDLLFEEKSLNKNKQISAVVQYLSDGLFNVKIKGIFEDKETEVNFDKVKVSMKGDNDIEFDIEQQRIIKAKFYLTSEGNVRVLKKDGSVTDIVNYLF
jgi:3-methylcrotonyl-CoA carboxylase alpha subunit